jgi:uncharacterized protein YbjT (DUF2867 family)
VKDLSAAGEMVRAGYRSRPPSSPGVLGAKIDLATGEGLDSAMHGVEGVFLLAGDMPDQTAGEIRVIEAAKRAGVRRIVKLSVLGAETEAFSFAKIHRPVEYAIEASGIPFTLLRPGSFMQNFVTYYGDTIRSQSAFYLPQSEARESHVDARDIARVAAKALTDRSHEGKAYDLVGPTPLTYTEAAEKLSATVGRKISYVGMPDDQYRKTMIGLGIPQKSVDELIDLFRFIRQQRTPLSSTAIKDVTGHDPIGFDQFVRDHVSAWRT